MTISHRDATQEAPQNTGAPREMAHGQPDRTQADGSVHICLPRRLQCSCGGGSYSSPRHMKGSYHKACTGSPAGRFGMPALRYIDKNAGTAERAV